MPKPHSVNFHKLKSGTGKKMAAIFYDDKDNYIKTVQFGAAGYSDYPHYYKKDPEDANKHKNAYLERHRVNENWRVPTAAGTLSRYILWNLPTLEASIADYKKRFDLK